MNTVMKSGKFLRLPTLFRCEKCRFVSRPVMNIFDTETKRIQKNRTTLIDHSHVYDYLREEKMIQMADRLKDIKRRFDVGVDFGCGKGFLGRVITEEAVGELVQCDTSEKLLELARADCKVPTRTVHMNSENFPMPPDSVNLVVSSLSLHWVNNLPGVFKQILDALKMDGCFLGCMFGTDTLFELRVALQLAEMEREGGFGPHVSPFTENRDVGGLMSSAGFSLLTVDVDEIVVNYPTIFELMSDLKGMGENNCAWNRKLHLRRESMMAAAAIYQHMFGNEDGSIPATFHFIHFIGWKPHPSQPKPKARGSAQVSLKDLGSLNEIMEKLPPRPKT